MKLLFKSFYFCCCIFLTTLLFSACKTSKNQTTRSSKVIQIEFNSESPLLSKKQTAKITIYGYDPMLADVSASVIARKEVSVSGFPLLVSIDLPADPSAKIQPAVHLKEQARYYLSFYIDANENGMEDSGDIKINFDQGFTKLDINQEQVQHFSVKKM